MAFDPISAALDIGGKLIDKFFPDPQAAQAAKLKLFELQQSGDLARLTAETDLGKAAASIVEAEAKSEGWLTRSWRPLTMLTFLALIVARMFGLTDQHIPAEEYDRLWQLVQIGVGGYVASRGIEKVAPDIVKALGK